MAKRAAILPAPPGAAEKRRSVTPSRFAVLDKFILVLGLWLH
ncbi:hypothetical protein PCLA_11r0234 [Pseudomonas citronellolis]|nr:hypothetical protein PCLA_11r0234 [Pseudomonas citronellolis]